IPREPQSIRGARSIPMSTADGAQRRVLAVSCPGWPPTAQDDQAGPGAREFEQVVSVVEDFCPQVEVLRPGICAIAVRGPARYFGGEEELARKISEAVTGRGPGCRIGVADGMFAALLAAGEEPSGVIVPPGRAAAFLAPLPVAALEIPELDDLLPRLGITTLGEFAALPAAEAANRFGTQGALAHRLPPRAGTPPSRGRPFLPAGVRTAGGAVGACRVRRQGAGRPDACRPCRPRACLRADTGAGGVRERAGDHPAVAARRAAVRARGGRARALAAGGLAGRAGRRRQRQARQSPRPGHPEENA